MTTWLYFATIARANERDTLDLARSGYLWRSVYNSVGIAIANVKNVDPGDQLVLLYEEIAVGIFEVLNPCDRRIPDFPAAAFFPDELAFHLERINYVPDKHLGKFTGFLVDAGGDEQSAALIGRRFKQVSRNALQRFDECASQETKQEKRQDVADRAISEFGKIISFQDWPSSLNMPPSGSLFLGIDVGYARNKETLGYCILQMGPEGIQPLMKRGLIRGHGAKTIDDFEQNILPALLETLQCPRFSAIALDGPMVPDGLNDEEFYRPQERFFLQTSVFPWRIRAQAYQSGIGQNLTEATMRLRRVCERFDYRYEPFSKISPMKENLIIEAFPKPFLALMFDPEHIDDNLNRFGTERAAADWTMTTWVFSGPDEGVLGDIVAFPERLRQAELPLSTNAQGMESILSHKDVTSAYVSALSAVLAFAGAASVLGSDQHGSFLLPASGLWHQGWHDRFRRAHAQPSLVFRDNV